MIARLRKEGLLWPSLLTLAGLAVLIGLGTWQLQRKAWKVGLIERIAQRTQAEPVPVAAALAQWRGTGDVEYLRVRARGRFRHEEERHLYALAQRTPGWHILTPFETPEGVLFVNRGFVPAALKDAAGRREGQIGGEVEVIGLVHVPARAPGWFTPRNDPTRNAWYWLDLDGLAATLAKDSKPAVLPLVVTAGARPENPGGWPRGGVTRLDLPDHHLEYALTWFGLALALIAVYGSFVRSRLK